MPEAMKKHHKNEDSILHAVMPPNLLDKARKVLQDLGCTIIEETLSWREAFPKGFLDNEPAVVLRGARRRENLTQEQLAKLTAISRRHLSEMENGKRPIGKENAKKLAKALKTDYRLFL